MRKTEEMPLLVFRLSTTFRVTIATHDVNRSHMAIFLKSWRSFLNEDNDYGSEIKSLVEVITFALKALNEALSSLLEGESIFTTQFNTCCMSILHLEHQDAVKTLLSALENTQVYKIVDQWLKDVVINNDTMTMTQQVAKQQMEGTHKAIPCSTKSSCCRLERVGKNFAQTNKADDVTKVDDITSDVTKKCGSKAEHFVTDSHYITMLLFSWPYNMELCTQRESSPYTTCLANYIEDELKDCDEILVNEAKQLRQQIQSLILMVNSSN